MILFSVMIIKFPNPMKIGNNSLHIILQNYTSTITELFLLNFFCHFFCIIFTADFTVYLNMTKYREYILQKQVSVNKIISIIFPQTITWLHSETGKQFSLQNLCSEFFLNPETAVPQQKPQFGEAIIEALGQEKI